MRPWAVIALCLLLALPALACARQQETPPPPAPAAQAAPAESRTALTEVVPGWPDYPGATLVVSEEKGPGDGWSHIWKRKVKANAPWQEARQFYADRIASGGWQVQKLEEKPGKVEWELAKGASWVKVEVDDKGYGTVEIEIERRDR
jgi:hypothetical protein